MNEEDIRLLSPERLDSYVAKKVMGWEIKQKPDRAVIEDWWYDKEGYAKWPVLGPACWAPTRHIYHVSFVLEKINTDGYEIEMGNQYGPHGSWYCLLNKDADKNWIVCGENTLTLAICRAALMAAEGVHLEED